MDKRAIFWGKAMIDILLNENRIGKSAGGDFMIAEPKESFMQDLRLELQTNAGELFYDENYGYTLVEFLHREEDAFLKLEIKKRIQEKLAKREEVDKSSIQVAVKIEEERLKVKIIFQTVEGQNEELDVVVSGLGVEVIT